MRKLFITVGMLYACQFSNAQNVGIGTDNPAEKLEVNGGIKMAGTNSTNKGTIRWNEVKKDFEGFNGISWVSLTGSKGTWGNQETFPSANFVLETPMNEVGATKGKGLGHALSINNDYVLIGSPYDIDLANGNIGAGSIRVMKKVNDQWGNYNMITLTLNNAGYGENFGASVALDGHSFIVGATGANGNRGRAYIYNISPQLSLTSVGFANPADLLDNDHFGQSVSKSGLTAAVGAPHKSIGSNGGQGKVYAYRFNTSINTWTVYQGITAPDGAGSDNFGSSVSISGNYLAIGAPGASHQGVTRGGKTYIYFFNGASWNLETTLTAPNTLNGDQFGCSLFLKDDTLVVGAHQFLGYLNDDGNGKAFVFVRNGSNWQLTGTLLASDGRKSDAFGKSVSFSDGQVIVGARYAKLNGITEAGKAYIFKQVGNQWFEQTILSTQSPVYESHFGNAVGIYGNTAIVGAPGEKVGDNFRNGTVYFFYGN